MHENNIIKKTLNANSNQLTKKTKVKNCPKNGTTDINFKEC